VVREDQLFLAREVRGDRARRDLGRVGNLLDRGRVEAVLGEEIERDLRDRVARDFSIPGTESQKAVDLLEAKFPAAAGAQSQVVFTIDQGKLTDAGPKAGVERSLSALRKLPASPPCPTRWPRAVRSPRTGAPRSRRSSTTRRRST